MFCGGGGGFSGFARRGLSGWWMGGVASINSYYFVHDQSRHRFVLSIRSTKYSGRNDGAFPSIVLHTQLNRQ